MATYERYKLKSGETRWLVKGYLGLDPKTGKEIRTTKRGFKTKKSAEIAWANIQIAFEEPDELQSKTLTFADLVDLWLEEYEKTVESSTLFKVQGILKNHVIPSFGDYKLEDITPDLLQDELNRWSKKYTNANKFFSYVTLPLDYAYRRSIIADNPANRIKKGKKKRAPEKLKFYDKEQLKQFMQAVKDGGNIRIYAFFRLLAFTGMRKGEVLALQWEDIDFKKKTVLVYRNLSRKDTGLYIKTPKTRAGYRRISIDDKTVDTLKAYQKEWRSGDKGLVFKSKNGDVLSPAKPRKWYLTALAKTDLPAIPIHGFRHTHCSLLFEMHATPKDVQYRMGHSDIKTTLNIYSHVTKTAKEKLAKEFNDYIDF